MRVRPGSKLFVWDRALWRRSSYYAFVAKAYDVKAMNHRGGAKFYREIATDHCRTEGHASGCTEDRSHTHEIECQAALIDSARWQRLRSEESQHLARVRTVAYGRTSRAPGVVLLREPKGTDGAIERKEGLGFDDNTRQRAGGPSLVGREFSGVAEAQVIVW
jgi:hypothetical protein